MKAVIDGKTYNTESARKICAVGSSDGISRSDNGYWEGDLYRTQSGRWFVQGKGNAASFFAEPYGHGSTPGSGIRTADAESVRAWLERDGQTDVLLQYAKDFGITDA